MQGTRRRTRARKPREVAGLAWHKNGVLMGKSFPVVTLIQPYRTWVEGYGFRGHNGEPLVTDRYRPLPTKDITVLHIQVHTGSRRP